MLSISPVCLFYIFFTRRCFNKNNLICGRTVKARIQRLQCLSPERECLMKSESLLLNIICCVQNVDSVTPVKRCVVKQHLRMQLLFSDLLKVTSRLVDAQVNK